MATDQAPLYARISNPALPTLASCVGDCIQFPTVARDGVIGDAKYGPSSYELNDSQNRLPHPFKKGRLETKWRTCYGLWHISRIAGVGNIYFDLWVKVPSYRVMNYADIVPQVPVPLVYRPTRGDPNV